MGFGDFYHDPNVGSIGLGPPCGPCWEYKILSNLELPEKAPGPLPLLQHSLRVKGFFFQFFHVAPKVVINHKRI